MDTIRADRLHPGDIVIYRDSSGKAYEYNMVVEITGISGWSVLELEVQRWWPDQPERRPTNPQENIGPVYIGTRAEIEVVQMERTTLVAGS